MRYDIMTNPIKERPFMELRVELIKYPVDYEEKNTWEDVGKTTGVSDTNVVQRSKYNDRHRSYTEYTRSTIKYPMASPQACVGGT